MAYKLTESSIGEFSERVISIACLPYGTELDFRYIKVSRAVRSDFRITRRHVTPKSLKVPSGGERVSEFMARVQALVVTDLRGRGIRVRLRGPDGELIDGKNHISTVREMPSRPGGPGPDAVQLFAHVVENAEADVELSLLQVRALYQEFESMLGDGFEKLLDAARARIIAKRKALDD